MARIRDSFLEDVARRCALLSSPTWLNIVRALREVGEAAPVQIADAVRTSAANLSQHLQRLAAGRIVRRRRDGQAVHYRIIDESIEPCAIIRRIVARRQGDLLDNVVQLV